MEAIRSVTQGNREREQQEVRGMLVTNLWCSVGEAQEAHFPPMRFSTLCGVISS